MNKTQKKDITFFSENFELSEALYGAHFMITGATGLIGSSIVNCLLALDKSIRITCPVRSIEKARIKFEDEFKRINFVECNLLEYLSNINEYDNFDFIIHCASPTAGRYMVEYPVETYTLAIDTTRAILEYARKTDIKSVVYVSSLEYYGQNLDDGLITEDMLGYVDNSDSRSSYPLGKRAAEFLCYAYAKQFGVDVKTARLTQTFGPGVAIDDNRVFAQFARSIIEGNDIVMHTKGMSSKPYCYTIDCVSAILYILIKGKTGEAYNVANPDTYISIRSLAEFLKNNFNPSINVVIEEHPEMGYAPVTKLNLSVKKLMDLGWKPRYGLKKMFSNLIDSFTKSCKD